MDTPENTTLVEARIESVFLSQDTEQFLKTELVIGCYEFHVECFLDGLFE